MMIMRNILVALAMLAAMLASWAMQGPAAAQYLFQPGDTVAISVWQEPRLDQQVVVAPDGSIALPLAGRIQAGAGRRPRSRVRSGRSWRRTMPTISTSPCIWSPGRPRPRSCPRST
jgi:hypothetical protein